MKIIDLFAGCGGLSMGFENAGFEPIYVNELNKDALDSYIRNRVKKFPSLKKFNSNDIKGLIGNTLLNSDLKRCLGGLGGYRFRGFSFKFLPCSLLKTSQHTPKHPPNAPPKLAKNKGLRSVAQTRI